MNEKFAGYLDRLRDENSTREEGLAVLDEAGRDQRISLDEYCVLLDVLWPFEWQKGR